MLDRYITLFGFLTIRILLFKVLYWGPLFWETPMCLPQVASSLSQGPRRIAKAGMGNFGVSGLGLGFRVFFGFRV